MRQLERLYFRATARSGRPEVVLEEQAAMLGDRGDEDLRRFRNEFRGVEHGERQR